MCVNEGLNIRGIGYKLYLVARNNHKSGSFLDAILGSKGGILLCKLCFILNSCLVEEHLCHTALGTGLGCEENKTLCLTVAAFLLIRKHSLKIERLLSVKLGINLSLFILLSLTVIPVLNGTVVACNSGVNLGLLTALGTGEFLACDIAVVLTR